MARANTSLVHSSVTLDHGIGDKANAPRGTCGSIGRWLAHAARWPPTSTSAGRYVYPLGMHGEAPWWRRVGDTWEVEPARQEEEEEMSAEYFRHLLKPVT
uniref:Uncharacterized protein n=1 Tax=Oryza punctata TaxID=4537 RepID=A0A0E0JZ14_ORYPU